MFQSRKAAVGVLLLTACTAPFLLSSCGGSSSSGIAGRLKIMNMATKTGSRAAQGRDLSTVVPSATGYSMATVDGIQITLKKVRGEDAASDNPLTSIDMTKAITLTGESSQAIALNEAITWVPGSYRGISLHFENTWKVKAYCKTQRNNGTGGYLVYTSATGVKRVDCTGGTPCAALPGDYDYTSYSFLSTYSGYVSSNDYNQDTHYTFSVAASDTPNINLLYDGSYNVVCWDGQGAWSTGEALGPYRGPSSDAERQSFWPDGTPAMATGYLPIFGYLTNDADETAPAARTFITSAENTGVNATLAETQVDPTDAAFSFSPLGVVTLVYKADGTIIAGSARNLQGFSSEQPLDLDLEGFAASRAGTDFFSSGWYWPGGTATPSFVRNRKFQAFDPPSTPAHFTVDVVDAAGCGQTLTDFQNNNPSRACLGTSVTQRTHWREMVRE